MDSLVLRYRLVFFLGAEVSSRLQLDTTSYCFMSLTCVFSSTAENSALVWPIYVSYYLVVSVSFVVQPLKPLSKNMSHTLSQVLYHQLHVATRLKGAHTHSQAGV
jgi:hypothetical protein